MKKGLLILIALITANVSLSLAKDQISTLILLAKDASIEGPTAINEAAGCITYWDRAQDKIRFKIPELGEGKYKGDSS